MHADPDGIQRVHDGQGYRTLPGGAEAQVRRATIGRTPGAKAYAQMFEEKRALEARGQGGLLATADCSSAFKVTAGFFALCLLGVAIFSVIRLLQISKTYDAVDGHHRAGIDGT